MDFQTQLEPRLLLQKSPTAIAHHFQDLVTTENGDINAIDTHLLSQVHSESIPATIYEIWFHLAVKHAPELLHNRLTDRISCGVRKASLYALRRKFHSRKWKDTWDSLGGAAGIKEIIDNLAMSEVKRLASAITHIKLQGDRQVISACVEELLRLVAESDRITGRVISPNLGPLIELCSESYVLEYLERQGQQDDAFQQRLKEIGRWHLDLLRRIAVGTVEVSEDVRVKVFLSQRDSFVRSQQEYVPVYLPPDMTADVHPGVAFCLDMVHAFSANAGFKRRIGSAVLDLIHTTLKLAVKKGCSLDLVLKFVKHILPTYFEHSERRVSWVTRDPLPREILRWWSIARTGKIPYKGTFWLQRLLFHNDAKSFSLHIELLEDFLLQTLRQQADRKFDIRTNPRDFYHHLSDHLYGIPCEERLTFIKFLCRKVPSIDVDLDTWPPSERESQLFPYWEERILRALPTSDAKWLFGRMLAIHGCEEFLPDPDGASPSQDRMTWTDQCLLKIDWEADEERSGQLPVAHKVLAESKRRATRERDPQGRLTWASAALRFAIASKSLDIFQETVEWSRRFLRDPVVFPGLLDILFSSRTASILSCTRIPGPRRPKTLSELKAVVEKSNEVLRSYLDIAHLIVREPHYQSNLTKGIPYLLSGIISQRIEDFEMSNPGTESERVETFLDSFLPIVLEFERLANSEDTNKFTWCGFSGAVSRIGCLDDVHGAVLSFLDRMAYERNQFWVEKRRDDSPEIMDLPLGFPRGLPLEYLLPNLELTHLANKYPDDMPYLNSRLAEVMVPTGAMLSVVPASVARKNYPIDSLSHGVQAVIEDPSVAAKEKELLQIWERFSDALRPYPDQLEIFKEWLADSARRAGLWSAANIINPPLPPRKFSVSTFFEQCSDLDNVVEWDPLPASAPVDSPSIETEPEEKKVERTILICRMNAADRIIRNKVQPEENPLRIWSHTDRSVPPSEREVVVLSALLYLDTLNQQPKRILRRPWPQNAPSRRYPAIFLADEFLTAVATTGNRAIYAAANALQECVKFVPAQLLRDVAVSLLDMLTETGDKKQPNYSTILSVTMGLIKLLQETDQPQLAIDVVLRVLKSFPDASSYHRQMRLLRLGKRLLPQDAVLMVNTFADFVCNAGKSQAGQSDCRDPSTKTQPYVKITTIKMLAQLLADATFVDISTCLRILQDVFNSNRHIDVRYEVVMTVLQLFHRAADFTSVFTAIASMAIAASGPSEREATPEADWLAAEKGDRPLPEVVPASDRPLLHCFLKTAFCYLSEQHRKEYLHKVLVPLLDESTRQHTRWIRCFLSQIHLTPDEDNAITCLSKIWAFDPSATHSLFSTWRQYLPKSYLHQHRCWALAYLHYSHVETINEKLSAKDKGWRGSTEGKHWLTLQSYLHSCNPFAGIGDSIAAGVQTLAEGGITVSDLVEEYICRAGIVSRHPVRFHKKLNRFVVSVKTSLESLTIVKEKMRSVSDPGRYDLLQGMMERIVADIESLRTAQWMENPDRSPAVLPSRLEMQMLLLPSPKYNPHTNDPGMEYGRRLMDLVQKCADNPLLLVDFEAVKTQVNNVKEKDLASFALLFGDDVEEDQETLYQRLKIDIAQCALVKIKPLDLWQNERLMAMIGRWKMSGSEWVRQVGWSFDGTF
ncbi:uncharacterized protein CDV56_103721 [Aspergillus thermomutatus]|uniref:Uncharacterized protein n=1 Tax=Aspergillus thermomutatus TaxID=41047 RepID=A0A397G361_ASPTH|nr:uncharacterized protein CDV56_103721 [Aspergillus thermomutatus]RHZ45462.1 hypothetical protein CDV56_103721 [Aspergillus thermomutatus]